MNKFVTTAATALTLSLLGLASPAMADRADGNDRSHGQYENGGEGSGYGQQSGYGRQDDGYRGGDRRRDGRQDFDRQEGNSDRWERGWGRGGYENFHNDRPMPYWRLVRRLEQQGYYGVRGLRMSHHGFGLRAFAFNYRGMPVMLRVNPYSGRVLDVRYV